MLTPALCTLRLNNPRNVREEILLTPTNIACYINLQDNKNNNASCPQPFMVFWYIMVYLHVSTSKIIQAFHWWQRCQPSSKTGHVFRAQEKKTHRVTQVHINIDQPTTIDGITYELLLRQLEDLDTHLSFWCSSSQRYQLRASSSPSVPGRKWDKNWDSELQ